MAASALFDTTRLAFAPPDDEDLEAAAAWSWLSSQAGVQAVRVAADSFHQLLRETQVLWWHRGSAVPEPSGEVLGQLGRWLQDGGRLWLTLQAVALLLPLGLEERLPDRLGRFAWKRGEGEIAALEGERRGLLGFGSHPIFAGLHGGAFLLSPAAGRSYPEAVYTGPTEGWLVAGEWQYLGVDAQRKLALEYRLGRGRVLAVGAHVLFAEPENRFRAQLERFARNCLAYLSGSPSGAPPHWPSTATAGVVRRRRPEPSPAAADKGRPAPSEVEGVRAPAAATLPSSPSLSSAGAADAQFDVAGGRAIVVGRERSGVSEVWSLPIRLARNLRSQFVGGGGPRGSLALWERAGAREFRRLPSHVERELDVDRDIRALQVVRAGAAEASITYRILAGRVSQLRVGFEVDLRYFWPYPEGVLGRPSVEEWGGGTLGLTDAEGTAWGSVIAEPAYDQLRVRRRKSGAAAVRLTFESPISEVTLRFRGPAGAGPTSGATPGPPIELETPDPDFNEAFFWAVNGLNSLDIESPAGRGLVAGVSETGEGWASGRLGYAWYFGRDMMWSLPGCLGAGLWEAAAASLRLLARYQQLDGKIFHELTPAGVAHFDAADSTPLFLVGLSQYFRWTGDRRLLEELWPAARRAFEFALTTDTDGDGLIENSGVGHGWAEGGRIYGGHCTFYLAACWAAALDAMHSLAAAMGQPRVAASCAERRDRVKSVLNGDFYREDQGWFAYAKNRDGSYANAETIEPAAAALLGLMEPSKLGRFFQEVAGERFTTPWGVRYIARDDPAYHPRGYHYGSVWPLFTGWVAMAEYRCGRPEAGFRHLWSSLQQVCKHSLGAIDEVLDGDSDVPAGVCPHQLWSHALTVMPVLEGMLGLRPDAPHNRLSIAPQLPATWDWVRVRRLRLGQRSLALMVERTPSGLRVEVENAAGPGRPEIVLRPPGGAA